MKVGDFAHDQSSLVVEFVLPVSSVVNLNAAAIMQGISVEEALIAAIAAYVREERRRAKDLTEPVSTPGTAAAWLDDQ